MIDLLYLTSAGFMVCAACHAFAMVFSAEQKKLYVAYACMCLGVGAYQLMVQLYFNSNSIEQMIELDRWRVNTAITVVWLFSYCAYLLFGHHRHSKFLLVLGTLAILFGGINLYLPYGMRIGEIETLKEVSLLGQIGSVLIIKPSFYTFMIFALSISAWFWVFYQFWRLSTQIKSLFAPFIVLVLLQFLGTLWVNIGIDTNQIEQLPLGGFAFVPIALLMSFYLSDSHKNKLEELKVTTESLEQEQLKSRGHEVRSNRLAQLFEQSPNATMVFNLRGELIEANEACDKFWGLSIERVSPNLFELIEHIDPSFEFSEQGLLQQGHLRMAAVASSKLPQTLTEKLPTNMWLEFELSVTCDLESEQADLLALHCLDVTERYYSQQAFEYMAQGVSYKTGLSFFDGMVENLSLLFNARIAFIGKLYRSKDAVSSLSVFKDGQKAENFSYDLKDTPCANVMAQGVCCYPSGIQEKFPKDTMLQDMGIEGYFGTPILDDRNRPIGILVVLDSKPVAPSEFLTRIMKIFASRAGAELQRHEAERQTRQVAYEDYLTRLPNRARAHQFLNEILTQPEQETSSSYLFMADMNQFKVVNDALGHDVGDEILRAMGQRLRNSLPDELFIARIGGDEFVFIYQGEDYSPEQLAQQILDLMNRPVSVAEHLIDTSSSIGFASIDQCVFEDGNKCDALDVMRHAELALYRAKKEGRSSYSGYERELESKAVERMQIRTALKTAIEQNALDVHFQPQINQKGECCGAEALVRWIDPELGFVSPALFIPIAEESGLIHQLGAWVNQRCFERLKSWLDEGVFPGHLSINVSAWQFALSNFAEEFISQVKKHQLPPEQICIELTESGLLTDIEDTIVKLNRLREFGLSVALDDFGTGYSSLAYLRDLPIDVLKIDKAFIDELEQHERSPLTESMIAIGHNMNINVVAEGVETEHQVERLHQLECDYYQGYFYARPMKEADFLQWLKER